MEDTKKMIERYKRELMELCRTAQKPEQNSARTSADTPSVFTENADREKSAEEKTLNESKKSPKIIGYVSEESGEFPAVYDRFLSEILPETNEADADNTEALEANGNAPDKGESSETASQLEQAEEVFVPDDQGAVDNPTQENEELLEDFENIFTPPKYSEIPSTESVREEITEQSDPAENYPADNASGVTDNSPTAPMPDFADVGTVSEEKAETLNDMPISGTDENEQLTGRSFEDERIPGNSPDDITMQGSRAKPIDYPEPDYESYEDFERKNTGRGTILFRVYTAHQAVPVENAVCVISKRIQGAPHKIDTLITDQSGQTRTETLPAPSKELSLQFENKIQPFALYDAAVNKNGFAEVILNDIPVFDGVQSIQRVYMIPEGNEGITEEITEVQNAEN